MTHSCLVLRMHLMCLLYFKGNDINFWLSFAKKRLVVELFQRHEAGRSSFDHEATNSNTSLLEKSKISTCQFCVSAGYGVREKNPIHSTVYSRF